MLFGFTVRVEPRGAEGAVLAALGLSEREDVVYRYLISSAPATAEEVRAETGLRVVHTRIALNKLERMGFVHRLGGEPGRFAAASPETVDAVITRKLADLRQAQEVLAKLAVRYRASYLEANGTGVFEVIRGVGPLRAITHEMVTTARTEALNMVKPPVVAVEAAEHVEPAAAVRSRVIFDKDSLADARTLDAISSRPDTHCEVRVHTMVPVKLLAIDRAMAIVPLAQQSGDVPVAVMITESAVLDSILALFDYVWETAVGFHLHDARHGIQSPLHQSDRQLLSLLLAGLTDQAIAAHFRVSVRTIERKVRALMDAAHVRTRMQLAWEAARQQWL
jgi:sugar-specific transcriptional regulator TrmB/DNA-binding CsgD family transcriptional regulator